MQGVFEMLLINSVRRDFRGIANIEYDSHCRVSGLVQPLIVELGPSRKERITVVSDFSKNNALTFHKYSFDYKDIVGIVKELIGVF